MKQSHFINKFLFFLAAALSAAGVLYGTSSSINNNLMIPDSTVSVNADSLSLAEGKKLYRSKCKKCHALYSPKDYKLRVWKENLDEMRYKAELEDEEYEKIFLYLKNNCKK